MNPVQLERLGEQLQRLRLFKSRERIEALLQEATAQELGYADFLDRLLTEEVSSKTAKNVTMRTSLARFPFVKGRSEEHTSELQSPCNLVCRLLLEKKKKQTIPHPNRLRHSVRHGNRILKRA